MHTHTNPWGRLKLSSAVTRLTAPLFVCPGVWSDDLQVDGVQWRDIPTEANNIKLLDLLFLPLDLVLENMVASKQLEEEHREEVQAVLLSRHRHQHQKPKGITGIRSLADIGKKGSARTLEGKGEWEKQGQIMWKLGQVIRVVYCTVL